MRQYVLKTTYRKPQSQFGEKVEYRVRHDNGREYRYSMNEDLPSTVVDIMLNGICKTVYVSDGNKKEYFYPAGSDVAPSTEYTPHHSGYDDTDELITM